MLAIPYTRLRFFALHPLCGIGVISEIEVKEKPADLRARTALSRPNPGPLTKTSSFLIPAALALSATFFAAMPAANGVDLRVPLKPAVPALPQTIGSPFWLVIVKIVLLKVA